MTITRDNKYFVDISGSIVTERNVYTIDNDAERLGVGGNAVVYECLDKQGNVLAIKFLMNHSGKSRKRFTQEIDLLMQLDHPHIIKCFDFGEIKGVHKKSNNEVLVPFLVMEKADMNIVEYMRKTDAIVYDVYAPQIRGLSEALKCLHSVAIHRDIKPENILVCGEKWLLSDFGLCTAVEEDERICVTKTQERVGPKYWLSPEATDLVYFGTNEIDVTSDIYQMCAVFWFIITRRYPLGIIGDDDYAGFDRLVCQELIKALTYNKSKRIPNGEALYRSICNVTINREMKDEPDSCKSEERIPFLTL